MTQKIEGLAVVIPCYNVEHTCRTVIEQSLRYSNCVVAVNDGSTDRTGEIVTQFTPHAIHHPVNQGKGLALRSGFHYVLSKTDYRYLATIDADGQHDATLLVQLVVPFQKNDRTGIVIGSRRFSWNKMPFKRWAANVCSSWIISKLLHTPIHDIQSGFRVYSIEFIRRIFDRIESIGFEIETEMVMYCVRQHFEIVEVPIPSIYNEHSNRGSSWRALRDSYRIARMVARRLKDFG